jgi:hypothetical protein
MVPCHRPGGRPHPEIFATWASLASGKGCGGMRIVCRAQPQPETDRLSGPRSPTSRPCERSEQGGVRRPARWPGGTTSRGGMGWMRVATRSLRAGLGRGRGGQARRLSSAARSELRRLKHVSHGHMNSKGAVPGVRGHPPADCTRGTHGHGDLGAGGAYFRVQCRRDQKFRLALGSFLEEYNNTVQIVTVRSTSPPHVASCMPSLVDRGGGSARRADGFATSTMHAGWLLAAA